MGRFRVGDRVRITTGPAKDVVGVVIAEHVPLKPRAWRTWVIRTPDLVDRRTMRDEYLEPA